MKSAAVIFFYILLIPVLFGKMQDSKVPLEAGMCDVPIVTSSNIANFTVDPKAEKAEIQKLCLRLSEIFSKYRWDENPCGNLNWHAVYKSKDGHPLMFVVLGEGPDTTLFFGGVHPDELTPVPMIFRLARYLADATKLDLKSQRVIIAPLVNPDGFLNPMMLRTNGLVDLNRNFPTLDWYESALSTWRNKHNKQKRYFPGYFPNSEIETIFQSKLIDDYSPQKILSIHAPLGFFDYDGPGDQKPRFLGSSALSAKQLVHAMSQKSQNYKVAEYTYYPGSLGNFAGNERDLPTITLELQATMPKMLESYWSQFLPGFIESIQFKVQKSKKI